MKKIYLFAVALVASVWTGCSQDEQLDYVNDDKSGFIGVMEMVGSRTALDDNNKVVWDMTDQVSIFKKSNANSLYRISSLTDGVANFEFVSYTLNGTYTDLSANYAVYPYSESNMIDANGIISVPVSDAYTFTDKTSSIASALMVAKSDDTHLNFTNAQGIVRLRLNAQIPEQWGAIQSITLKSLSDDIYLSGTATMSWTETDVPEAVIVVDEKAGKELTIELADDLKKNLPKSQDGEFFECYVPVVPAEFAPDELMVIVKFAEDKTYSKTINKEFDVIRKTIKGIQHTLGTDSFDGEIDGDISEVVSSAAGLYEALSTGENVTLTGDVDLSDFDWTSIAEYSGILDGGNFAIRNLEGENGLFETLNGATIKNLRIENVNITATSNHTGALAGSIKKDAEAGVTVINNVTVSGTVNGGDYYTGGLIGAISAYHAEITGCVNNATVMSAGQQVGGIAGYAKRDVLIESCKNEGAITGAGFVGGIIGLIAGEDDDTSLYVTVKECSNTGAVTANGTTYADYVGGIAGVVGREGGNQPINEITASIIDCKVADDQKILGGKINVATGGDEKITVNMVCTVSDTNGLATAINNGFTEIVMNDGNYTIDNSTPLANKNVTFSGSRSVIIAMTEGTDQSTSNASLVFDGVTINYSDTGVDNTDNYKGIKHASSVTYQNCAINGLQFLYATEVLFEGCDLKTQNAEHCVWTYGADKVTFNDCDFTYVDRAVNCYSDQSEQATEVTFTQCTFTKIEGKEITGAIETNSSIMSGLGLTIGECTVNEGSLWWVSEWDKVENVVSGAKTFVVVDDQVQVGTAAQLAAVVAKNETDIYLLSGKYDVYGCANKTLTIRGTKEAVLVVTGDEQGEAEGQLDYCFDGSNVTFDGITIRTNNSDYAGYTRLTGTYNNCIFENNYCLQKESKFIKCTFEVSGNQYNIWTWGADKVEFEECVFNCDGKSILVYNQSCDLTVKKCVFNDNGDISGKAAIEACAGDYGAIVTHNITVTETTVNGFDKNNSTSTLWGNKNNLADEYLNITVDGTVVF